MEASESTSRPGRWFKRCTDVKIVYVASAGIICVGVGILWFVMLMLSDNFLFGHEVTSILFLLAAVSGLAAFSISYTAEAQERLALSGRSRIVSGRRIAATLLVVAYLAMVAAIGSLWI